MKHILAILLGILCVHRAIAAEGKPNIVLILADDLGYADLSCYGRRDIPRFIDLWRTGRLDLDGMITARRPLTEVNEAMADMTAGVGLRTVLEI